jgi:hypothetical protein
MNTPPTLAIEEGTESIGMGNVDRYFETHAATALPLWLYKGALTHVQSIPLEDRTELFKHKIHSVGSHPLETR